MYFPSVKRGRSAGVAGMKEKGKLIIILLEKCECRYDNAKMALKEIGLQNED